MRTRPYLETWEKSKKLSGCQVANSLGLQACNTCLSELYYYQRKKREVQNGR